MLSHRREPMLTLLVGDWWLNGVEIPCSLERHREPEVRGCGDLERERITILVGVRHRPT